MQLTVNGEQHQLKAGLNRLDQVVEALGHHPKLVVVEFNGQILTPDPVSYTHLTLPTKA